MMDTTLMSLRVTVYDGLFEALTVIGTRHLYESTGNDPLRFEHSGLEKGG